jgi:hypothetical protein
MKNFALVIAFALLAVVPASAAEISKAAPAAPAMTPVQQTQEAIPLFAGFIHQPVPRCYAMEGTSCQTAGSTTACTDVCFNNLSCTCYDYYGGPYNNTFLGRYWHCNEEC